MWNSQEYYDKILTGWEKSESSSGVPYYVNHNCERTQWDHPVFVKLMEELSDMNSVRYAAYRTALKLRYMQKRFLLDVIDVRTINVVFARYGYRNQDDAIVDCATLQTIIVDLYNTNRVQNHFVNITSLETIAEIIVNWLLNMFDRNRAGCLLVCSVKIALATMCSARISEKYAYFFSQICDSTNHLSRKKMTLFLRDIMQLPELINESAPFGGLNIAPAVESCFAGAWKPGSITEDEFLQWLLKEPQTVVWLPTLHRLAAADAVKHEAKCSICKAFPIVGFRYKCLKCFNYDLCQECFFNGRTSKKHKLKHPTQEYCFASTAKQDTKDFLRTVRNNLSKKHRNKKKLRYLPIRGVDQPYRIENVDDELDEAGSDENGQLEALPDQGMEEDEEGEDYPDSVIHNDLKKLPVHRDQQGLVPNYKIILKDLQKENRLLRRQLEQLTHTALSTQPTVIYPLQPIVTNKPPYDTDSQSGSESSEVEWLREERERMEAKQEVLEAHNKQLELQLYRLRLLLKEDGDGQAHSPLAQHDDIGQRTQSVPSESPNNSPMKNPPPPYHTTPSGRPHQPIGQSVSPPYHFNEQTTSQPDNLESQEDKSPAVDPNKILTSTILENENTTLDNATLDKTYQVLQQTHYSLPSPSQSRYFPDEEAELEELMNKLDQAFPVDMTHSLMHNSESALDDVYSAANKIGAAFSGFLGNIPDKAHDKPDGDEADATEEESGVMYETADMTGASNFDTVQLSVNKSAVTPCSS